MHYGLLSLRAERIEKNKGKHLILKCLPRISLNFNIQGLTFNRTLRCSKKSFVNGRCVKLLETYVKHFHIYL